MLTEFADQALADEAVRGADASTAVWPPTVFPITYWCGPPAAFTNIEQYRKIAAAGFNVVMPPCDATTPALNHKILDICRSLGLKAIVSDARIPLKLDTDPKSISSSNLRQAIKDYSRSPALMGYFLTDEPGADSFTNLAAVCDAIHALDPDHMVYVNLFPNYASTDLTANPSQLNALTYDLYLQKFINIMRPDVLSWDHYFFLKDGDRPGFLGNLAAGKAAADSANPQIPFWQVVLSVKHGPYRALSEPELRYEAMQTLVYGAKGLVYFTYWLPNDPSFEWSDAVMNKDGTDGPLYAPITKVNAEVAKVEKWIFDSTPQETWQTGETTAEMRAQPEDARVKQIGPGNLSVGSFLSPDGSVYLLAANRDYKNAATVKFTVDVGSRTIERLDLLTGKWKMTQSGPMQDGLPTLTLEFQPASAILLRWK